MRNLQNIAVGLIHESALNPRTHFDVDRLNDLAASMRTDGVVAPLLGRPHPAIEGAYELAAGHRRLRAAKLAELAEVPLLIEDMSDARFVRILNVENLQREDVHALDEAAGFANMMAQFGYDQLRLSAELGKDPAYVCKRLSLLDLIPELRALFLEGKIGLGHALLLAPLQAKDQKDIVEKQLFEDNHRAGLRTPGKYTITVTELKAWISQHVYIDLHSGPWKKDDETLVPAAGSCVNCTKRTGYSPNLFPELAAKDVCLDGRCFEAKSKAFLKVTIKALEGEKGSAAVLQLSTRTWSSGNAEKKKPKLLIKGSGWRPLDSGPAKKSTVCPSTRTGVIAELDEYERGGYVLGQALEVCVGERCKIHTHSFSHSSGGTKRSAADILRAKEAKAKEETAERVRRRIYEAVRDKGAAAPLAVVNLRVIARVLLEECGERRKKLQALWPDAKAKEFQGYDAELSVFDARAPKLPDEALQVLILELALERLADPPYRGFGAKKKPADPLLDLATYYRIDVKAIEKEEAAQTSAPAAGVAKKTKKAGKPLAKAAAK